MTTPSQAEFLLRLAENSSEAGEEVINEIRRLGTAHAQRLLGDKDLIEKALEINRQDLQRFAQYLPARVMQQPAPRALINGGSSEEKTPERQRPQASPQGQRS